MLSLRMISKPHTYPPAPNPTASRHKILRAIISPATSVESTLPPPPASAHSRPLTASGFPLDSTLTKAPRGEGSIIVNQISDEEICPDERSEEGPLFPREEACLVQIEEFESGALFDSIPVIVALICFLVFFF